MFSVDIAVLKLLQQIGICFTLPGTLCSQGWPCQHVVGIFEKPAPTRTAPFGVKGLAATPNNECCTLKHRATHALFGSSELLSMQNGSTSALLEDCQLQTMRRDKTRIFWILEAPKPTRGQKGRSLGHSCSSVLSFL